MKTILFYDTESNGLVEFSKPSDDPCQPNIVQLAAQLCVEETGVVLGAVDLLIRPDGWVITPELTEIHGITTEHADKYGVPIKSALDAFLELWINSDQRCGHNESFDMRMLRIAIKRCPYWSGEDMQTSAGQVPFADYWKAGDAYCTQGSSTKIVNAARPAGEKKKTAKLIEAYRHFFGRDFDGAHSAQGDMLATKAVYYAIRSANV
ncbi:MAG: 3'-5' exonuclease [Pseudomonadota bacterium]